MSTSSPVTFHRARARKQVNGILRPSRHPVIVVVIAAAMIVILTGVGLVLRSHPVDLPLSQALNALHSGSAARVTDLVYAVFEPVPAVLITVVVTGIIWAVSRQLRVAVAFAGVVAATWIPSDAVKLLVHRPRPDVHFMANPFSPVQLDPSYPSGHTVFITALAIAVIFVLRGTRWLPLAVIVGAVVVPIVALSLSIDAVHYPTDVLASILWSLAVAPAVRVIWVDWLMPLVPALRDPADPESARRRNRVG
ncbi:hypothetical protein GCM10028798_06660 [Humibacter antri]